MTSSGSKGLRSAVIVPCSLLALGLMCLAWSCAAWVLRLTVSPQRGKRIGRFAIHRIFRAYMRILDALGAYRFDVAGLDALRGESGVLLAPNHPNLLDALAILAAHPNLVCIMKFSLRHNWFFGPGARLAGYITNDSPHQLIKRSAQELREGAAVLLFPEGTRTTHHPVNPFQRTVGAIAKQARAPVQTLLIETDSPYLSKGWPLGRFPNLPIRYRIRPGRRFDPPLDVKQFTDALQGYFIDTMQRSWQTEWLASMERTDSARQR